MANVSLQQFTDLITTTLGLQVREQDQSALWDKLMKRVQALDLSSLDSYYQLLASNCQGAIAHREWRELINLLTVNESYFFRDQGQFALLRQHILPTLIKQKQDAACKKEIRVWSAGCSTGEEAYSLAILLQQLIPANQGWTVLVLGTDVNESALEHAKRGVYSNWSFRLVDSDLQRTYFRQCRQGWTIDPSIRSMVTFQLGNLVQEGDSSAQPEIYDLDLIVCRNVFIYFNKEAIASAIDRFYRALKPGGYLITGHTELYGHNLSQFQIQTFPDSLVYRRQTDSEPENLPRIEPQKASIHYESLSEPGKLQLKRESFKSILPGARNQRALPPLQKQPLSTKATQASPAGSASSTVPMPFDELLTLMKRKAYAEVISQANQFTVHDPQYLQVHCLMAEAYANLGDYCSAIQVCQQVLQSTPFAIEPFYLLAQIAQEKGNLEEAKSLLKRIIYLAPSSAYAYFELGCLYEQQGNMAKAQRSWRSTMELLKPMSQQATVNLQNSLTVRELQAFTEQKLNRPISTS